MISKTLNASSVFQFIRNNEVNQKHLYQYKTKQKSWAWYLMSVISVLRRLSSRKKLAWST